MMNTVQIWERESLRLVRGKTEPEKMEQSVREALARRLCSAGGCGKVRLAPTPALAMGQAVSLARTYGKARHGKNCTDILVLTHRAFDLWLANAEGFSWAKPQDPWVFGKIRSGTVCAVVFSFWEPGQAPMSPAYGKDLFSLCRSAGVLLISDETALGLGRTGSLLAWQGYGKLPDLTVTALGGGLGACLLRGGLDGPLGGEEPAAEVCAQALGRLDALLAPGALDAAADAGRYLRGALSRLPGVTEVQGLGLALSASLNEAAAVLLAGSSFPALTLTIREDGALLTPKPDADKGELAQSLAKLRRILEGA